jgi:S-adenosylmethionine-diacylgycerolhomoserine-N-methlytransferase
MSSKAEDPSAASAAMDRVYRHQRHIYDLTRKFYLLGRDHLIGALAPPPGGAVLELGCGTARNLIAAAYRYPDAHFYGLDVSAEMLATAAGSVHRAGLDRRIALISGDATAFDAQALFGRERFDRVFFSYALSMIPPWRQAIDQALVHVAPGGRLHLVDFGRQEQLPGWFAGLLFAWLKKFEVTPRADLEQRLAEAAARHGGSLRWQSLFRGYACYAEIALP